MGALLIAWGRLESKGCSRRRGMSVCSNTMLWWGYQGGPLRWKTTSLLGFAESNMCSAEYTSESKVANETH